MVSDEPTGGAHAQLEASGPYLLRTITTYYLLLTTYYILLAIYSLLLATSSLPAAARAIHPIARHEWSELPALALALLLLALALALAVVLAVALALTVLGHNLRHELEPTLIVICRHLPPVLAHPSLDLLDDTPALRLYVVSTAVVSRALRLRAW